MGFLSCINPLIGTEKSELLKNRPSYSISLANANAIKLFCFVK